MCLAVLALLGQMALGVSVPRQAQETVASLFPWLASICHAAAPADPGGAPGKHPHRLPGWMVCPFCLSLSVPLAHPSAPVQAPRPAALWVAWRPSHPPARAPPSREPVSAQPRAPPALV
jgi:hypothetical protein